MQLTISDEVDWKFSLLWQKTFWYAQVTLCC